MKSCGKHQRSQSSACMVRRVRDRSCRRTCDDDMRAAQTPRLATATTAHHQLLWCWLQDFISSHESYNSYTLSHHTCRSRSKACHGAWTYIHMRHANTVLCRHASNSDSIWMRVVTRSWRHSGSISRLNSSCSSFSTASAVANAMVASRCCIPALSLSLELRLED